VQTFGKELIDERFPEFNSLFAEHPVLSCWLRVVFLGSLSLFLYSVFRKGSSMNPFLLFTHYIAQICLTLKKGFIDEPFSKKRIKTYFFQQRFLERVHR